MSGVQKNPDYWDRLEAIRERLEAATETVTSTWVCYDGWGPPPGKDMMRCDSVSNGREDVIRAIGRDGRKAELVAREADLLFVCYAPEDIDFLLDALEDAHKDGEFWRSHYKGTLPIGDCACDDCRKARES